MFDAIFKGALASIGLSEEDANELIVGGLNAIREMNERTQRLEARQKLICEKLGIPPLQEVLPQQKGEENDDYEQSGTA